MDAVELKVGLLVSVFEPLQMGSRPGSSVHVWKSLCVAKLVSNGIVEKPNAVFGSIVGFEEVGGVYLEVVEKLVGSLFGPLHQLEVVVDLGSVIMGQGLGCTGIQVVDGPLGLDY